MSIDWSKAPEGATHWDTGMNNRVAGWMKLDDGVWYWWPAKDAVCALKWHASLNQHMIRPEGFIERPAPWNGEGLPLVESIIRIVPGLTPIWDVAEQFVGVDCRLKAVFMLGETQMVAVECIESGQCCCFWASMVRTPEQIAEEERYKEIEQLAAIISAFCDPDPIDSSGLAGVIYYAGWQQVKS